MPKNVQNIPALCQESRPHPLAVSARIIKCHDNYNYGSQLLNETQSAQKYHFSTFCLSCCSLQCCRQINEAKQNSNLFIAQSVRTLHRNSSFSQKSNNTGLYLSASDPKACRDKRRMAQVEENLETGESRVATMLTVRGSGSGASILRQDHFV